MSFPFDELAQWIEAEWNVSVLNVVYDIVDPTNHPRLQVILEDTVDTQCFRGGDGNYDHDKQRAVTARFVEIIGREGAGSFDVDGLFVVFPAFAPLARMEADDRVSDDDIHALKTEIGNPDLWEVSRLFGHVTLFFYTDEQVRHYETTGKKEEHAKMYFAILKPHDEFGYLREDEYCVEFDSKQNFDSNYNGNGLYYYR